MTDLHKIYFTTIIKKTIVLEPNYHSGNINDNILKKIKDEFEAKCIEEGYVKEDSCKITKRSLLKLVPNVLNGYMYTDVRIKADICLPIKGNIIDCKVEKINKMGLISTEGPLSIVVPRSFHKDKDAFKDIEIGSAIVIEVIGARFDINWDHIDVISKLYNPNQQKKKKIDMKIIETGDNTDLLEEMSDNEDTLYEENGDEEEDDILDDVEVLDEGTIDEEEEEEEEEEEDDEEIFADEEEIFDEDNLDEEGNMVGGDHSKYSDEEDESDLEVEDDYLEDESVGFESDYGDETI